ncbi:MAG: hypothetical protein ACLU3I_00555 [Acutalibacteraceae bacterium]
MPLMWALYARACLLLTLCCRPLCFGRPRFFGVKLSFAASAASRALQCTAGAEAGCVFGLCVRHLSGASPAASGGAMHIVLMTLCGACGRDTSATGIWCGNWLSALIMKPAAR